MTNRSTLPPDAFARFQEATEAPGRVVPGLADAARNVVELEDKTMSDELWKDIDFRIIDQRIGVGIGGQDTILRAYHKPSGILVEVPRLTRSTYYDREIAIQMIETALTHPQGFAFGVR